MGRVGVSTDGLVLYRGSVIVIQESSASPMTDPGCSHCDVFNPCNIPDREGTRKARGVGEETPPPSLAADSVSVNTGNGLLTGLY